MQTSRLDPIESIVFVGGRLCLDFINTANWIEDAAIDDRLAGAEAARIWAKRKNIRIESQFAMDIEALLKFREALRRVLSPTIRHAPSDLQALNDARGLPAAPIDPHGRVALGPNATKELMRILADSAADLLLTVNSGRVKACDGPKCGWLFADESPSNRRRWCSMASCGNRAKADRHYRRRRERA